MTFPTIHLNGTNLGPAIALAPHSWQSKYRTAVKLVKALQALRGGK